MDAVDAPLLDAVGALLLAEAGGVGGESLGQLVLGDDLVDKLADHGVLGGADEVEILSLDLIHHGVHLGLAHDALHHVAVDHEGGDAEGEALVDHEVAGVGQHRLVEAGDVAHQVVEAGAGYPAGGVHVDAVEGLHDLGVVGDFKGGNRRLAEALYLYVAGVVGADGHGGIDDVGNLEQDAADLRGQLSLPVLQEGQPVGVGLDLGLQRLGLGQLGGVLLGLPHQYAHLLALGVAGGAQFLGLLDGAAVLCVQLQHLIHQGELLFLKFLLNVLLHGVGIFPDEFNVQHG